MRPTPLAMPAVRPPTTPVPDAESIHRTSPETDRAGAAAVVDDFSSRAFMLQLDGPEAGLLRALGDGPEVLGRHPSCSFVIEDASVSRHHARISRAGDSYEIEDLGSRNGTFVQNQRVERATLKEGDVVRVGSRASFRLTVADAAHEALLRRLYESGTRDPLTGAYNRRHLTERLSHELAYATRHGTDVSVILLDVDHFKRVNDELGHPFGDAALMHLVHVALRTLRAEDLLARYGGEEFVVVLRGSGTEAAVIAAERIRQSLAKSPVLADGLSRSLTVSAGCAALSECPGRNASELFAKADERLYTAKHGGRNRVVGAR
jgi:diguanylate cyclase (GGDEF)-like protein